MRATTTTTTAAATTTTRVASRRRGRHHALSSPSSSARSTVKAAAATTTSDAPLPRTSRLGHSGIAVTDACLGTMTWGVQNTEAEAHEQLDYAIKQRGVNFIDTAEMYPVPMSDPSWMPGTTEKFIGSWLAKNSSAVREDVVLATKIAGFGASAKIVGNRRREETTATGRLDRASIKSACDASLARLQTDYIDLYQIHWPDRYVPIGAFFGSPAYNPALERADAVPIRESVEALGELIKAGKIKHYGLSNESTFGVCEFVRAADELGVPRPVSIQNSFCLLHRGFETELAEACAPSNFDIGLLPWTPLGGGALTGKYLDGASNAAEGRLVKYAKYGFHQRYLNDPSRVATAEYKKIADEAGVTLATLALAWCKSRFYVSSTIIGATSMTQLKENIDAFGPDIVLSEETLVEIDRVHERCRDPSIMSDFS